MLVFLIHGVATQNSAYADPLKRKVKDIWGESPLPYPIFYSSFWGHSFQSRTDELFNWVRADLRELVQQCGELKGSETDILRYQEHRQGLIGRFIGDFLTYLNTEAGPQIRRQVVLQFREFLRSHPYENQVTLIAHSLGTLILWDLLFSPNLPPHDPAQNMRRLFQGADGSLVLHGIVTMGSPLLFTKLMQTIDFAAVDEYCTRNSPLTWINILHASDIVAYPLGHVVKQSQPQKLLFADHYLWMNANPGEVAALRLGQSQAAMAIGVADAHGSYWNNDVVARLITLLLQGKISPLLQQRVHTGWRSYSTQTPSSSPTQKNNHSSES